MKAPFPAPISNWHNDTYAELDPTHPEVSAAGKTVVITGGGTGIGRATVEAFAQAKAASIAITGRRVAPLEETKKHVEAKYNVPVQIFSADVTDQAAMRKVASEVGPWDVLVNNAGYYASPDKMAASDIEEWWKGWEINIKGTFIVWQAFQNSAKDGAVFLGTATAAVTLPDSMAAGKTSYVASKQGLIRLLEILAVEQDKISVRIFHPGVIQTEMAAKVSTGALPVDKVELPAHFTVWLASPDAAFLEGRMVSCNFDINELKEVARHVPGSALFRTELKGFSGPSLATSLKL